MKAIHSRGLPDFFTLVFCCAVLLPCPGLAQLFELRTPATVSVYPGEIVSDPERFAGQRVRMRNVSVSEVFNSRVFSVGTDVIFGRAELLVLMPQSAGALASGERVAITGIVRRFFPREFARDFDWFREGMNAFTDPQIEEWIGRPIVIAHSVQTRRGTELVMDWRDRETALPPGVPGPEPQLSPADPIPIAVGELTATPRRFLGQMVSVHAEVSEVLHRNLVTLDHGGWFAGPHMLVLLPRELPGLREGDTLSVAGDVRWLNVARLEREYGRLDPSLAARLDQVPVNRPVLVAHSVRDPQGRDRLNSGSRYRQ
jgi:hypothetical protein